MDSSLCQIDIVEWAVEWLTSFLILFPLLFSSHLADSLFRQAHIIAQRATVG
jgi:hypothetical protein